MVKSIENGTSLPPFLVKCYEMVNEESTDDLISWTESNDSFIIWDESKFASQLLPKYFKHSNFSSFVRQLNIYGFRKINTDRWQFANEAFIKGQRHLLKNITRRKHPQSQTIAKRNIPPQQNQIEYSPTPPSSLENKRIALFKEVEKLKADRSALAQELKKLRQHQQSSQSKLLLVREQLKLMEKNQQQMLSFIVMAMQNPEFLVQFFQPKDNSWRVSETGNSKLSEVTDYFEPTPDDKMIVMYQPPHKDEDLSPPITEPASNSEGDIMEFDFSSDEMKDLFMDIDLLLGQMDDNVLPLENDGQLIIPYTPGHDVMMDQLLLSSSACDDEQREQPGDEHKSEGFDYSSRNIASSIVEESKKTHDSDDDDAGDDDQNQITEATQNGDVKSDNVEVLTKQMGSLTSVMSERV